MPNFLDAPEILPLPNLQTYSSISFVLLSCAVYYAFQVSSEPNWKFKELFNNYYDLHDQQQQEHFVHQAKSSAPIDDADSQNVTISKMENSEKTMPIVVNDTMQIPFFEKLMTHFQSSPSSKEFITNHSLLLNVVYVMVREPLCVWILINMCCCLMILLGKFIQKIIFGELRSAEQRLIKNKFWNFLLYKFIFVFSVINVQSMEELLIWCVWFSIIGFMYILALLCKERFSVMVYSPSVSKWNHFKLLSLLVSILVSTTPFFFISFIVGMHTSYSIGIFLLSEILLLLSRTLHSLILYLVHLLDLSRESIWEMKTSVIYYIDLIFDLTILIIDFCHHLHMLFWANIILSVSSLVILIQLQVIFTEMIRRIRKHNNYLKVINLMEQKFPIAAQEELSDENNDCAICWDRMEQARKLPCNHYFHTTCLRSWLEQDTSCPTCRHSLRDTDANVSNSSGEYLNGTMRQNNTRFFHFDGPRYARWLPTVSLEVTSPVVLDINLNARLNSNENSPELAQQQIQHMGQQVLEWFPQFSLTSILEDLNYTHSIEHTIENILDGRLNQSRSIDNIESQNEND
ncbi:Multiple PDZ domain protein [Sarcoptes scabiei]|nr:Multiple PDZ domain protein [Sarcoptes scabiei]